VAIETGRYGFVRDAGGDLLDAYPESANASEAGNALLESRAALLALDRAEEAVRAHASKTELYFATTDAFADRIASWSRERQSLVSALEGKFAQLASSRSAEVAQLAAVHAMQAALRAEDLVAIALMGEGLGDARPTVSILLDPTSKLRSCQRNIRELVETIDADVTPFAEITSLRPVGRSVSPLAGVNALPPQCSDNRSLGGLPLVSQYTVLIDPTAGEDRRIDGSELEDIRLRVQDTYQDLFPAGLRQKRQRPAVSRGARRVRPAPSGRRDSDPRSDRSAPRRAVTARAVSRRRTQGQEANALRRPVTSVGAAGDAAQVEAGRGARSVTRGARSQGRRPGTTERRRACGHPGLPVIDSRLGSPRMSG
jgi:hypothetical protein